MVNVGIFYVHLDYFMSIWYNLWPFGVVCGHLLIFSQFGMFEPRKIWQHWKLLQNLFKIEANFRSTFFAHLNEESSADSEIN
jgi:hypothetical protein